MPFFNIKHIFGLGDFAYYLFRPVVYAIDWVWGTDMKDCDVCKERRRCLNSKVYAPVWAWILFGLIILSVINL